MHDWLVISLFHGKLCKLIVIDLCKQQKLDDGSEVKQQIDSTGNVDWAEIESIVFIFEEVKETIKDFLEGIVKVL